MPAIPQNFVANLTKLRRFADRGGSVLLSSHLLHEVEVIADELVIIGGGRIVAQGAKTEMLAGAGTIVRTPDGATRAVPFKQGWRVYRGERPGSLVVVCPD